jgi:hypothetical protein
LLIHERISNQPHLHGDKKLESQIFELWAKKLEVLRAVYSFYLNKRSFLEEGRRIKNNLWFFSTIAQFT